MKVEVTSRVIMKIKGDNLSKAPASHLENGKNTMDFIALYYDYFSSWHWQLLGSTSQDSVRCGFQEGLASKGQVRTEISLAWLRSWFLLLSWHSPWGSQFSAAPKTPFSEFWLWLGLAGSVLQVTWSGAQWASHVSASTPFSLSAAQPSDPFHEAWVTAS